MKAMWLTKNTGVWYLITLASLALVICGLMCLIRSLRPRRGRLPAIAAGLGMLAAFALFLVLMDCGRYAYITEYDPRYRPFQIALFELPWGLYASLEAADAAALALLLRGDLRYRRSHLTPDAIRHTLDLLPEALCVSAGDGTILLSNLRINELCRTLTGSLLSDARAFWRRIGDIGEEQNGEYLVHTPQGTVLLFARENLSAGNESFVLISAADVTERYRILSELREKNTRLQEVRRRMKSVSDLSAEMFTAQEEAGARAALHSQLGQVLLMCRHWLDHPESTDARQIYLTASQMNRFLLGDIGEPDPEPADVLEQARTLAGSIGVRVEISGEAPREENLRNLLAQAIRECAANTVKHAEGSLLSVAVSGHTFRFTNNGRPPRGPVAESGGLRTLRENTEAAGGQMAVESAPAFSLTLRFP